MSLELVLAVASTILLLGMFFHMLRPPGLAVTVTEDGILYGRYVVIHWNTVDRVRYHRNDAKYDVESGAVRYSFTAAEAGAGDSEALMRALAARARLVPATPEGPVEVWEWDRTERASPREHSAVEEEEPKPAAPAGRKIARGAGALAALGVLLLKFGKFLPGLAKFLPTLISMGVMIGFYAMFFGLWFAAGFVVLIFIHEMGHAVVMWAKGLKTGPIVFIPFIGAFIAIKSQVRSAAVEAEMAYGGPAAGTLAATACFGLYLWNHDVFWLSLAYIGFLLNLFNLIPLSPLDGGRVVTAISTKLWILGLVIAGALVIYTWNVLLLLILILGCARAYQQHKARGANAAYYRLSTGYRALISVAYFGLAAYLGYMIYWSLPYLELAKAMRS